MPLLRSTGRVQATYTKVSHKQTTMKFISFLVAAQVIAFAAGKAWMNKELSPSERAAAILAEMTLDEKILMLHGTDNQPYTGGVPANDRLGIPALKLNDGPQGYRDDTNVGTTTAWPSAMTAALSWDRDLVRQYGEGMGEEFFLKGANVQLGPGMNLHRVPLNGRNFEYVSGADPYFGEMMVQPLIRGIQSQGVIANAKHWVHNNQETDRDTVSENVDERTRFEMYYPPFLGAIEANVGSFMCSYNKINSAWSCENPETLRHDLKEVLGYENGWVMSDWGATHSLSINEGLDQEMPGAGFFGDTLKSKVESGEISMDVVNDSVRRILVPMFEVGIFDKPNNNVPTNDVTSDEHKKLNRLLSASSHVLLKNKDNLLPLDFSSIDGDTYKIALLGSTARAPIVAGGGSGSIMPAYIITPYQGLMESLGIKDEFHVTSSCDNSTLISNFRYAQWGCESAPAATVDECCKQCAAYALCNYFYFDGGRCNYFTTNGEKRPFKGSVIGECKKQIPPPTWQCSSNSAVAGGKKICLAVADGKDINAAVALAKEANVAIVSIGTFGKEGSDRDSLSFAEFTSASCAVVPPGQDNLVEVIAASGTPTIVAATAPGAVLMPWRESVHSILFGGLPGQEYGYALADVILGNINPSARISFTLPNSENEMGFTPSQYPGIGHKDHKQGNYTEGLFVDYRWYTAHNVKPAFAFGHGLSWTSFSYSDLTIAPVTSSESTSSRASTGLKLSTKVLYQVSVTIKNSGTKHAGSEVGQLYIQFPEAANSPPLALKGFLKTNELKPGESTKLVFDVRDRDLSVWEPTKGYKIVPGNYKIFVGASSQDLRLHGEIVI